MIRILLICLFVCLFECVCRVLSCLSVSESTRETKAQHTQHRETPCCGCDWLVGWLAFQCLFVCLFVLDIWFFPFFSPPSCRKTKAKKQTKAKKEKQRSKEAKKRYSLSIMSSEPPSSSTGDPPVVASSLPPPPPPPSSSSSEVVVVVGGGSGGVTQPPKEQKKKPENLVIPPPKPKLSKAERRALQEQQRAAKAAAGKGGAQQGLAVAVAGTGGAGAVAGTGTGAGQPKAAPSAAAAAAAAAAATATTTTGASSSSPKAETTVPTPSLMTSTSNRGYFSHLSPYRDPHQTFWIGPIPSPQQLTTTTFTTSSSSSSSFLFPALHPAVIDLGRRYAAGIAAPSGTHPHHRSPAPIRGGNARCRAMLECYQRLLRDGVPPPPPPPVSSSPPVDVRHYVEQAILKAPFQYWTTECRPHSVSMGNALSVLKTAVASIPRDECTWERIVPTLHETISLYWHERIVFADKAIADLAVAKLLLQPRHDDHGPRSWSVTSKEQQETMTTTTTSGRLADDDDEEEEEEEEEVIVTYGRSQVVAQILIQAAATLQQQHQQHQQQQQQQQQRRRRRRRHLRVIVVDSRPLLEGRELLQELRSAGIDCTYILLNGLTYVLQDKPSKVLLGASAVMSDGSILGRVGTASVALAASAQKIPVLVCCETYKISNRVQLESITHNELGNPEQVMSSSSSSSLSSLKALNLLYDLTPAALVSGIVTELGIVPPTSIAVLLREMNNPHSSTSSSTVSNPAPAATPVH